MDANFSFPATGCRMESGKKSNRCFVTNSGEKLSNHSQPHSHLPFPNAGWSRYAGFFSFRARHSRHSLQRFVWSSSRWQIATAVFSNAPRRSSNLHRSQAETAIGNPTWETSWTQSMTRPEPWFPVPGSTGQARTQDHRRWSRTGSWQ